MNTILKKDAGTKSKVFISFVLDESSSMSIGKDAIESGMNEQISTIKKRFGDGLVEPVVSFVKFNHEVSSLYEGKTLDDLVEFEKGMYSPNGMTALYDAVGYTLDKMEKMDGIKDEGNSALLVVITDGEENSSRKYNASQISERITALGKTEKWTITYLGPNDVDLSKVQQNTRISSGNMYSADLTSNIGYSNAFRSVNTGLNHFADNLQFAAISGCSYSSKSFYNDTSSVESKTDPDDVNKVIS